jgi:hypothetical protein
MTQERSDPPPPPAQPPVDLSWKANTIQWGTRAVVHKDGGLTLGALNTGAYGEIPDVWEDRTRMPRGAYSPPGRVGSPIGGYYLRHKSDLWADNAADLYEEGISRRWSSAESIPWESCRDLAPDVEMAICQVSTELSQQASIEVEIISGWLQMMAYGYHEVKLFLATENFDAGRHFEVFRKRAMVNGGGLGLESPGNVNRILLESFAGWSETSLLMHILRGTYTRTVYRYLSAYAPSPVEMLIGRRTAQDKSRHIAYAMQHAKYAINHVPGSDRNFSGGLAAAEAVVARDDDDSVMREAMACAFGGGVRQMDEGMKIVARLRRDYVRDYLKCLDWIGINRRPTLSPGFAAALDVKD